MARDIYDEIRDERAYQQGKWGNDADDTKNTANDFVAYIAHHSTRWFNGGFAPYDSTITDGFRDQMVKVAALAVAAIESIDRQREKNGHVFYEKAN